MAQLLSNHCLPILAPIYSLPYDSNACLHCSKAWHAFVARNLSDILRSTFEVGAAKLRFVSEMAPKSSSKYVWTEALFGLIFVSVQKLSDMVNINLIWYLQKWWFNKSFLFPLESLRVTCYEVGGKTTHFLVQNNETSLTKQYWKAGTHTHISQKPAEILAWVSRDFLLSSV